MKRRSLSVAIFCALASSTSSAAPPEPSNAAARAVVVVRVGNRTVTAGELEDRLAAIPKFQLADFSPNPEDAKRKFVEGIVVPELLLEAAAEKRALASRPHLANRLARARANATVRALRNAVPAADKISADEVKAYYEEHRAQYDAPERVAVWRILVTSKDDAERVIEAAKKDLTVNGFTALARDKSIDKATNLRAGNLGFLSDDGVSNEAGLRADPAVVRAAKSVKDGELVPAPVAEGSNFAVVWRRGTVKATKQTLAEADTAIRTILSRRKADEAISKLVDELKRTKVGPIDVELMKTVDLPTYLDVKKVP